MEECVYKGMQSDAIDVYISKGGRITWCWEGPTGSASCQFERGPYPPTSPADPGQASSTRTGVLLRRREESCRI